MVRRGFNNEYCKVKVGALEVVGLQLLLTGLSETYARKPQFENIFCFFWGWTELEDTGVPQLTAAVRRERERE